MGSEFQERADGVGGLSAGAQFEDLAEKNQSGDDGGGFEIYGQRAVLVAQGGGEELRRDRGGEAEEVRGAGAEAISVNMLGLR